jgi:ureidoacrylate peracid hydrolase
MLQPLQPEASALLVVDMQQFFLDAHYWAGIDAADAVVPAINRVAAALRAAGGLVVWIVTDGSPAASSDWTVYRERLGEAAWQQRCSDLAPGSDGGALHPDLQLDAADLHFVKTRFSAFRNAPLDLDRQLRARGIETLLVGGVTTEVCCESTMRDAMMLNYRVLAVEDALAAKDQATHEASLQALCPRFADRTSSSAVSDALRSRAAGVR